MTKEEAIHILRDSKPSTSIGEEKVLERVANVCFAIDMAVEALKERKTGKWIDDKKSVYAGVFLERECHCSECGWRRNFIGWQFDAYCSHCGAKMEVDE